MYQKVIDDMKKRKQEIQEKINVLQEELKPHDEALKAIQKLQENYAHEKYKVEGVLAVQTGACPFPDDCNYRKTCIEKDCRYDTLDNGRPYRFS